MFFNVPTISVGTRTSLHKFKKLIELVEEEEKGVKVVEDHQRHLQLLTSILILLILQPTLQFQI